jgi:hypothetical protein
VDRRQFMGMGGATAALLGANPARTAPLPLGAVPRSLADWGVESNVERDQSQAMQRAIDELTSSGLPIVIPAGRYRFARLQLPTKATVIGIPGLTILTAPSGSTVFACWNAQDVSIRGVAFIGTGLAARDCQNVSIFDCQVISSAGDGFSCSGAGLFVANNRVSACSKSGIRFEGDGILTGNLISGEGQFGLRLGGPTRLGTMTVTNNTISGVAVGIGASNAETGYALIMMNMIAGTKSGGIRAVSGEELIGRDLTKGGSEAFRNIGIAANVSI